MPEAAMIISSGDPRDFTTLSMTLSGLFAELQSHADEYKGFERCDSVPCVGTFKINGSGKEVRVALDLSELRRAKMLNFRETFSLVTEIITDAERLMNQIIGSVPPPTPPNVEEFEAKLKQAVEDGYNLKDPKGGK